jgi:hypothetical protein
LGGTFEISTPRPPVPPKLGGTKARTSVDLVEVYGCSEFGGDISSRYGVTDLRKSGPGLRLYMKSVAVSTISGVGEKLLHTVRVRSRANLVRSRGGSSPLPKGLNRTRIGLPISDQRMATSCLSLLPRHCGSKVDRKRLPKTVFCVVFDHHISVRYFSIGSKLSRLLLCLVVYPTLETLRIANDEPEVE